MEKPRLMVSAPVKRFWPSEAPEEERPFQPFGAAAASGIFFTMPWTMTCSRLRQLLSWMRFMGDGFCPGWWFQIFFVFNFKLHCITSAEYISM